MKKIAHLIIGLGNHVMLNTRHSVGMQVCNVLATNYDGLWHYKREYKAYVASISIKDDDVLLIKSKLPMNLNGKTLKKAVKDLNIKITDIIVLHDDLDRALGKISMKMNGSAGGHNGVKSVIASLSTDEFKRLRIGIGRPKNRHDVVNYVLQEFSEDEFDELDAAIERSIDYLESYFKTDEDA